jgi:catechol 2,3-dioxygenase-like lactoylglutathione lyase family enzyme
MTQVETISVSISVANLDDAIRFFTSVFGFTKSSAPVAGAVLRAGTMNVCRLEKRAGTWASTHRKRRATTSAT